MWVREAWHPGFEWNEKYIYRSTHVEGHSPSKWKSPLYMPREASRILLKVESVKLQRLRNISEKDCYLEGMCDADRACVGAGAAGGEIEECCESIKDVFERHWDMINRKRGFGWKTNPWVWVVGFSVVSINGSVVDMREFVDSSMNKLFNALGIPEKLR